MISIIYSSNRIEPKFNWFIQSLWQQTTEADRMMIEVVFIDYCQPTRLPIYVNDEFKIIHAQPKPNIYQGNLRKTKGEYFSPCNARNTGILLSSGDYLVFVDDVSVLMPEWFSRVKKAYEHNKIVCGAYQKHYEMVVNDGLLTSSRKHDGGIDSRWDLGSDSHPVKITGAQMFGCSLGIPASVILKVNGFDEICDSIGGEDYHLGMRLNNIGEQIWYDRRMLTIESEELHNQPYLMKREDRVLPVDEYIQRLQCYGLNNRFTSGNWDSSHLILDILLGTKQTWTIGNNFDLSKDREHKVIIPPANNNSHWFDGKKLIEML
jgi:glycosyltransferase involved in cell wall biosynthesis